METKNYDAVVIGAGHAGVEAALALARLNCKTLLLTLTLEAVGFLACNPNIGGSAKGQLVGEIDALGGQMGRTADKTTLQLKMLNIGKGPAVHSLRAQVDKTEFHLETKRAVENQKNLHLLQAEVKDILVENGKAIGIRTTHGEEFLAETILVCTGVYQNAKITTGEFSEETGPSGFKNSKYLSNSLKNLGFELRRFKTGTPPRVDGRTIDFSQTEEQAGDEGIPTFSWATKKAKSNSLNCYLTYTNVGTHKKLKDNLSRAPMYTGSIKGVGARYCPSIEDKIVRFADKDRHQIFLEPESAHTNEIYLQGFSTSMPTDVQREAVRTVVGLENAWIMRFAYAIEYDCIDSQTLLPTLESKNILNLFFAGQINGTSGYEEAGAQGLVAGINAAAKIKNTEPVVFHRSESYIGVLIDDLVTVGTNEPYRMMTSRAEHRLFLRQDNADVRLTPIGRKIGLVSDEQYKTFTKKQKAKEKILSGLKNTLKPSSKLNEYLTECGQATLTTGISIEQLLKRTNVSLFELDKRFALFEKAEKAILDQITTEVKFSGYLSRQEIQINKIQKSEDQRLSADFDYSKISGLRIEARQKLNKIKPLSIGQAGRISGVTPADVSVLLVYLKKNKTLGDFQNE